MSRCHDYYELSQIAEQCGWWGWQERPPMVTFRCGCPEGHQTYVSSEVTSDPEYYNARAAFIRQCVT